MIPDDPKPLRVDAERNRQRILDAARELFAERGLGVTLNDIAHHAGVGVGTVYRRFPDKNKLIDDLFEQRIEDLVGFMDEAVADPDPWHGITVFLERALELQASDRGVKELLTGMPDGLQRLSRIRDRLFPLGAEVVRRAHESGQLRQDIEPQDLPIIQLMITTLIDAARDVDPDLWRRYLQIVLRGLSAQPELEPPLEQLALRVGDVARVMSALGKPGP
ncbi:MAG TPA: helix-turn-helix domain-containing protein [Solirubrobacteraceae bacterium]|nr:helix-turn-helix domain-containing protein [Solirubrobacteraceae bacterium]